MIKRELIPQTLLLSGPEGVGKATLARHFAAQLLGYGEDKINAAFSEGGAPLLARQLGTRSARCTIRSEKTAALISRRPTL